jgi:arabinose-5-phosphate isomerase
MGDVMAVVFEKFVGLSREGFAQNHPGGILGKSLRLKVKDLMTKIESCPTGKTSTPFKDIVLEMTKNPVGACAILDAKNILQGIIVDGDIRRAFVKNNLSLDAAADTVMNATPVFIGPEELASRALELMEKRKNQIAILPVIDESRKFYGFIRLHDLLKEGFNLSS